MNLFWLQFSEQFKKKILLQIRDLRSLCVEILFPIILILAGLGLIKLVFVEETQTGFMSPTMFPVNNLLYNSNGTLEGDP
mmetsp:Transcript_5474/g.5006  ORF Transcript_5474/g.5006 Transcript_5474/m.5006 type:complete len:80 (-) Transcript_5474:490-729(-)